MNNLSLNKSDKKLAVLIDPDKHDFDSLIDLLNQIENLHPDYILIGGSLVVNSSTEQAAKQIRSYTSVPLVLFPGHFTQLTSQVDHILLLSLISGRNADLLIGQHVLAAPKLKELKDKITPTGYMLIDGGKPTSVSYISNTSPIPADKIDIGVCTAIAGEALGMDQIYLDAGSGAMNRIPAEMISGISKSIAIPIIVGGGIRKVSHIESCWDAGANLVVIGNGIEDGAEIIAPLVKFRSRNT